MRPTDLKWYSEHAKIHFVRVNEENETYISAFSGAI